MSWQEEDLDDAGGALTVEMAPLPAAVPVDSPDVAHGPEQQQAKLTHEAAKLVVEEVEKDIPRVHPSPAPSPGGPAEAAARRQGETQGEGGAQGGGLEEPTPQQDADVPARPRLRRGSRRSLAERDDLAEPPVGERGARAAAMDEGPGRTVAALRSSSTPGLRGAASKG